MNLNVSNEKTIQLMLSFIKVRITIEGRDAQLKLNVIVKDTSEM